MPKLQILQRACTAIVEYRERVKDGRFFITGIGDGVGAARPKGRALRTVAGAGPFGPATCTVIEALDALEVARKDSSRHNRWATALRTMWPFQPQGKRVRRFLFEGV